MGDIRQYKRSFQLLIFGISWPIIVSYSTVGLQEGSLSSVQYTFIASEYITANTKLLQLLETRYIHWNLRQCIIVQSFKSPDTGTIWSSLRETILNSEESLKRFA